MKRKPIVSEPVVSRKATAEEVKHYNEMLEKERVRLENCKKVGLTPYIALTGYSLK